MSEEQSSTQEIELVTMPYACFSAKLQEVTLGAINDALEKAYLTLLANPTYLFCSRQDYKKICHVIAECTNIRIPPSISISTSEKVWLNQTTGKLMHIVMLPRLEDSTLLFGFFGW